MELKACPFCGGKAEATHLGSARRSTVICCAGCGATLETGKVYGLTEPIAYIWNTRPTEDRLAARVQELEKERDEALKYLDLVIAERDEAQDECLQQAAIIGRHIDDMDKCAMEKRGMECERDELALRLEAIRELRPAIIPFIGADDDGQACGAAMDNLDAALDRHDEAKGEG